MESLYLLIPVSIVIVLLIGGLLAWSVLGGQFDDLDTEGRRILENDAADTNLASGAKAADAKSSVTSAHSGRASRAG